MSREPMVTCHVHSMAHLHQLFFFSVSFCRYLLLLKIQHKATSFVLGGAAIFVLYVYDSSFSHEIWGHGTLILFPFIS